MIKATRPIYKHLYNLLPLLIITTIYITAITIQLQRYQNPGFNCIDMTKEAKQFWENLGFKTKPMEGTHTNSNTKHMWLKIEILPNTWLHWESCWLMFMDPTQYYQDIHPMTWW